VGGDWWGEWGLVGVSGVLDKMTIRLTQPQVELELGLSLANKTFAKGHFFGSTLYFMLEIL
jgi:hypothetical protein